MEINNLNLYYRRKCEEAGQIPSTFSYDLPISFRSRFIDLCFTKNIFLLALKAKINMTNELVTAFGVRSLYQLPRKKNVNKLDLDDVADAIYECKDDIALSIIEFICRCAYKLNISDFLINTDKYFQHDRIGFKFLTEHDGFIVKIEDETFYNETTAKTLSLLSRKKYFDAQNYFIDSYKKLAASQYNDALVDIGRAMETVLKTRLTELSISFNPQTDTLNKLLDITQKHIISPNHNFHNFKQIILDAGRARNISGHGNTQGQVPALDEVYVRFIINQTAANLLFLMEVPMQPNS